MTNSMIQLFHSTTTTRVADAHLTQFPNCVPVADGNLRIKDLPLETWVPFLGSEGYSDGRLIKRVDIDRLLILPYWDLGWAYDKKQSCLIRTDCRGLRFSENPKETDGFYTEISADALLLSDFFRDEIWDEMLIREVLELDLELYSQYFEEAAPKKLEDVYEVYAYEQGPSIITKEEIESLYDRIYYER